MADFLNKDDVIYLYISDTSAVSRYCVRQGQLQRKEGCYSTLADSGYVKQCFCYSHLCNGATSWRMSVTHTAFVLACAVGTYWLGKVFFINT